jgi:tripartite-type tricarboxylate transporter receptor subunit TctC
MVAAQTDLKTLEDLRTAKTPVKFSSSGVGSSGYNDTMMLAKGLKWNMKIILGYDGTDSELAMRRGEIDAAVSSLSSADLFAKNGYGRILVQIGGKKNNNWPLLSDVVTDKDAKAIAALIGSQAELARFTAGPPAIPADRTAALRAAYRKAMEDEQIQTQAAKADRPIEPAYGEDVANMVKAALDQSPETIALVSSILNIKPPSNKTDTKLISVSPDGRNISFMHGKDKIESKVSGSRTKIKVGGSDSNRKALKAGMECTIDYKPGGKNEPKTIDCK